MRSRTKIIKAQLEHEVACSSELSAKLRLYKCMSRSFWEGWRWELQRRKECMAHEKGLLRSDQEKNYSYVNSFIRYIIHKF